MDRILYNKRTILPKPHGTVYDMSSVIDRYKSVDDEDGLVKFLVRACKNKVVTYMDYYTYSNGISIRIKWHDMYTVGIRSNTHSTVSISPIMEMNGHCVDSILGNCIFSLADTVYIDTNVYSYYMSSCEDNLEKFIVHYIISSLSLSEVLIKNEVYSSFIWRYSRDLLSGDCGESKGYSYYHRILIVKCLCFPGTITELDERKYGGVIHVLTNMDLNKDTIFSDMKVIKNAIYGIWGEDNVSIDDYGTNDTNLSGRDDIGDDSDNHDMDSIHDEVGERDNDIINDNHTQHKAIESDIGDDSVIPLDDDYMDNDGCDNNDLGYDNVNVDIGDVDGSSIEYVAVNDDTSKEESYESNLFDQGVNINDDSSNIQKTLSYSTDNYDNDGGDSGFGSFLGSSKHDENVHNDADGITPDDTFNYDSIDDVIRTTMMSAPVEMDNWYTSHGESHQSREHTNHLNNIDQDRNDLVGTDLYTTLIETVDDDDIKNYMYHSPNGLQWSDDYELSDVRPGQLGVLCSKYIDQIKSSRIHLADSFIYESNRLRGRVDHKRITRHFTSGTRAVFKQTTKPEPSRTRIVILVDQSGSMNNQIKTRNKLYGYTDYGGRAEYNWDTGEHTIDGEYVKRIDEDSITYYRRYHLAQEICYSFMEAFKDDPTCDVYIYGHSAKREKTYIGRYSNVDDIANMKASGQNRDGYSIYHTWKISDMDYEANGGNPNDKCIMFVLADGSPSASVPRHFSKDGYVRHTVDKIQGSSNTRVKFVDISGECMDAYKMYDYYYQDIDMDGIITNMIETIDPSSPMWRDD